MAGKRAIVTGASSGIGRAVAVAFATEGARVVALGRDPHRTAETCLEIQRAGGEASPIVADFREPEQVVQSIVAAACVYGCPNLVVNCAGISEAGGLVPVAEQPLEGWMHTLAVNLTAPFLVAKTSIPYLLRNGGGAMVHISSIAATVVLRGNSAYGASKAGLNQLSNHIAVEYAGQNIRSNVIMPGEIETPASDRAFALGATVGAPSRDELLAKYPMGRFGQPDEVAQAAVFLCSDESLFLTGAAVAVDGAFTQTGY